MYPLRRIAQLTPRYSGSDLVEICKQAARYCVLEHIKRTKPPPATSDTNGASAGTSASASRSGKAAESSSIGSQGLPKSGGMPWDAVRGLMEWPSSGSKAEQKQRPGAQKDGNGTVMHDGEVYGDADGDAPVVVPKVSAQAQLTEAALIKCVAEVCLAVKW